MIRAKLTNNNMVESDGGGIDQEILFQQPRTLSTSLYYRSSENVCDNDPSNQPGPNDGIKLYETAEECCKVE